MAFGGTPKLPANNPVPPARNDNEIAAEAEAARKRLAGRKGRQSTILAGELNLPQPARATLLGN